MAGNQLAAMFNPYLVSMDIGILKSVAKSQDDPLSLKHDHHHFNPFCLTLKTFKQKT